MARPDLPTTLPGGIRLERVLGEGGWSVVYAATLPDGRPVAIKCLNTTERDHPEATARFAQEAAVVQRLDHPGLVRIIDVRVVEGLGEAPVLLMEHLVGEDLEQRVRRAGRQEPDEVLRWFTQTAAAVAHAHAQHVVHRDLKPSNIFLCRDGRVVLLDLGLAKDVRVDAEQLVRTQQGAVLGTPMYMAPEQARGQTSRIGPQTDVWALGLTAIFALTGQLYWRGKSSAELMAAVLTMPLYRPSARWDWLPETVDAWFFRSCARVPGERFDNVRLQADLLARALRGEALPPMAEPSLHTDTLPLDTDWDTLSQPAPPLPRPPTRLVGRDDERRDLAALLTEPDVSLVTLLGAGGAGKTRLAIEVAHDLERAFEDGVFYVPLDGLTDPELLPTVLADALHMGEGDRRSDLQRVKGWLRTRSVLLVLDNFEHLLPATRELMTLLSACPQLTVLVTSRSALNIRQERRFPLHPLPVPQGRPGVAEAGTSPAVALLVDRIQAVRPDFALTHDNVDDIVELVRRLDGVPLALELAAGRMRLMAPEAVLRRFGDRLPALSSTTRDLPDRQRTVRAAVDWSYHLLDAEEQQVFRALSVFAGSFDLDAAEVVCEALDADAPSALEALIDHSLVTPHHDASEPRFRMLGMLRQYGLERLAAAGERDAVFTRWVAWAVELAERGATDPERTSRITWLRRIDTEHDNLRAALDHALTDGDAVAGVRLAGALTHFWYIHGHYEEGRRWLGRALELPEVDSARRALALRGAGRLAFLQCDYAVARYLLAEAEVLYGRLGDAAGQAEAAQVLGSAAREQADYEEALARHYACFAVAERLGDARLEAHSLAYIGFAAWLSGDTPRAIEALDRALAGFEALGEEEGRITARIYLGGAAMTEGRLDDAEALLEEALDASQRARFQEGIAWSRNLLGVVALERGDLEQALRQLKSSLKIHTTLGDAWRTASVLEAIARVVGARGDARMAAHLMGAAASLRDHIGTPVPAVEAPAVAQLDAWLADSLREDWFDAREAGRALELEEAVALVRALGRRRATT